MFGRRARLLVGLASVLLFAVPAGAMAVGSHIAPPSPAVPATAAPASIPVRGAMFPVTFVEHGLPDGANWTLTIQSGQWSTENGTLTIEEPNGTYLYSAYSAMAAFPGYANGSVTVAGAAVTVALNWSTAPGGANAGAGAPSAGSSAVGIPPAIVALALVALVALVVAIGLARERASRGRLTSTTSRPSDPPSPPVPDRPEPNGPPVDDPLGHML